MAEIIQVDEKFEELRRKWFAVDDNLFNILESIKYRETAFIRMATEQYPKPTTIRNIKANALIYLSQNFYRWRFLHQPFNMYASVAVYPNMPMFSWNPEVRRKEMDDFNDRHQQYMTQYDLLVDIDNRDLKQAYAETYKCKEIFRNEGIPYTVCFSGNKGFHLRIAYLDFPEWMQRLKCDELIDLLKRFMENFRTINGLYSIDLAIYDSRRQAKVPYSVVYPYYLIALPLSDDEFNHFTLEYCSMVYWLDSANRRRLYKRGLLKRAGTAEAVGNMIKKYTELK